MKTNPLLSAIALFCLLSSAGGLRNSIAADSQSVEIHKRIIRVTGSS